MNKLDSLQSQYFFLVIYFFLGFLFTKIERIKNKEIAILMYIIPGLIITALIFSLFKNIINLNMII